MRRTSMHSAMSLTGALAGGSTEVLKLCSKDFENQCTCFQTKNELKTPKVKLAKFKASRHSSIFNHKLMLVHAPCSGALQHLKRPVLLRLCLSLTLFSSADTQPGKRHAIAVLHFCNRLLWVFMDHMLPLGYDYGLWNYLGHVFEVSR